MGKKNKQTKKILNENWKAITALSSSGVNYTDIANQFGVSRQALTARLKKSQSTTSTPDKLKVLILDIENAPMTSYTWGLWNQNINDGMRVEGNRSYMMTVAAKWLGSDEIFYYETRTEDDSSITAAILQLIDEADLVVGNNAKKFDLPKINAYAM